jgi:DNA-directed RNA polymerase subunit RPC12/RpoP
MNYPRTYSCVVCGKDTAIPPGAREQCQACGFALPLFPPVKREPV